VIGGGGKEHAIVWKLSQSRHVNRIYCCPGNAGIAEIAECIDVSPHDFDALVDFVKYEWIDLTIVGHEEILSRGIVDAFEKEGCRIFGPNRAAAQIGSSRVFAKDLMRLYRIPTAEYKVFTSYLHAEDYVRLKGTPIVIKADGSVEENGVFVASTVEDAIDALRLIMKERIFGDAGKRVIVEENLKGEEVSFMVFTDERTIMPLAGSQNYKRMFNGNTGPDTKGMGAYSPAPIITNELEASIMEKIMRPALKALNSEGIKYKGILYAGLMVDKGRPYVLKFNCVFGDPETQTVLPRLKTDLMDIVLAIIEERLSDINIEWRQKASVCVVVTSRGYSDKYQKDIIITGLERVKTMKDVVVFHAGTSFKNDDIVTSGGRVISVTATGADIKDARAKAYKALEKIHFDGMHYRKDIG
ncbi:MAG: phosphoribosylamine--glycine ligase, partial [Nitrospirota bacterium]